MLILCAFKWFVEYLYRLINITVIGFGKSHTNFVLLLPMHGWILLRVWGCRLLSDHDAGACFFKENVPIETFNISFESTQNM